MSLSALDDPSPELVEVFRDKAKREREFKRDVAKKYRGRSEGFFGGYMAYATGFKPDRGALYYEAMPEMAVGWLCAQRDHAQV
jgi:hypothetical protein